MGQRTSRPMGSEKAAVVEVITAAVMSGIAAFCVQQMLKVPGPSPTPSNLFSEPGTRKLEPGTLNCGP